MIRRDCLRYPVGSVRSAPRGPDQATKAVPELLVRGGHLAVNMVNHRLTEGVIAILVAWRFKKIMPTIVAGMAALWLLQWLPH